jgi:hypothetical protein
MTNLLKADPMKLNKFPNDWEEFTSLQMCNAWVATAIIGAGAVGAAATAYSANKAADAQKSAANTAANTSLSMYNTTRGDLSPYRDIGGVAANDLTARLDDLTAPIVMDQAELEKTPGYQFTLGQGLKATQNAAAARGLGVSGAALKGAATFATGLADNTYKTQFDIANTNKTNAFNRLKSLVDVGENAGAQTGTAGTAAAKTAADAQIGAGNAQAAADNATGKAVGKFANDVGGYMLYKGLYGDAGGGGGSQFNVTDVGLNMAEIDTSSYKQPDAPSMFDTVGKIQDMEQKKLGIDKSKLDLVNARYGIINRELSTLISQNNVTPDDVIKSGQNLVKLGLIPPDMYAKFVSQIPKDPAQIKPFIEHT